MNYIPPTHIQLGKRHPDSNEFADAYVLSPHKPPYKLTAITVQHTSESIQGIGFTYTTRDNELVQTQHNFCNYMLTKIYYHVTETTFKIDNDDFIKEIRGRSGDWLDRIEFITYMGKNQNFGGKGGEPFSYSQQGYTFGVFGGGYRENLDYLIAQVVAIPDNYIQYLENKQMEQKIKSTIPQTYTSQIQYPSTLNNFPQHNVLQQQQPLQVPNNIQQYQSEQQKPNYNYPPLN